MVVGRGMVIGRVNTARRSIPGMGIGPGHRSVDKL